MKTCSECKELKEFNQFSKRSVSTDGLQPKCKKCNSKDNLKFRTEKPEHHQQWQWNNCDRVRELVRKFRKADKSSKIYSITNPLGETYIGMTNTPFSVRLLEHRAQYRKDKGRLPELHKSFDKFGFENHKIDVILELEGIDRKQLGFIETSFIQAFKQKGKSLNIRTK
jgi:hypothetical protein